MSRGSILLILGIFAILWSGELLAQTVSPPVKIRPLNQPSWESKSQTLYSVGRQTPVEVPARLAQYEFAAVKAGESIEASVVTFVDTETWHVWAGLELDFYVDTDAGIVGAMLQGGTVTWCESLIVATATENIGLDEAVKRLQKKVDYAQLIYVVNGPAGTARRKWGEEHVTDLRYGVFKGDFFAADRSGRGQQRGEVNLSGIAVEEPSIRLDIVNTTAQRTGSVWIDIQSRKLVKVIDGDEQTFPKKAAGDPSK